MRKTHDIFVWISLTTIFCFIYPVQSTDCKYGEYDLTPLNRTWDSRSDGDDIGISYQISLCTPLQSDGKTGCHPNTAVCMTFANGSSHSAGNYSVSSSTENETLGEVWVFISGDTCIEAPHTNLTTSINLKCGPNMGSPKFLDYMYCVSYFEWESHVYCKVDNKPVEEVPCYLYDEQGLRYDLSPLAKVTGGYLVSSEMNTDVYINVCRDVAMDVTGNNCPEGYGAYRKSSAECIGLGKPKDGLQKTSRGFSLKYESGSDYKPSGCTTAPSTTIIFICPKRGGSKDPLVIQDFDCQYVVEWQTEYACPEAKLSNNTCVLTNEDADINIDLTPLKNQPGTDNPYKVTYKDSLGVTYDFYLNVCEELNIPCPKLATEPVCQTKPDSSDFAVSMGSLDHMTLKYADNDLLLIYKGGALCHSNHFQRQTIIEFLCDLNAGNDGRGQPEFDNEFNCTYRFTWKTKYACLNHPVDEECRVNEGNNRYDLSSLVRNHGDNWMALGNFGPRKGEYYINVCHNILKTGEADRCDPGAAVCFRDAQGSRNLGRYQLPPTFDNRTKTIQIKYTEGDTCVGARQKSSTITFVCKPGDSDSAPTLTYVSFDECIYEFEWQTSAACVLGHHNGTQCKVFNDEAGFNFDLTPLRKIAAPYYKVNQSDSGSMEYLLNVCGPVTGTACNSLTGEDFDVGNTGICQQPKHGQTGDSYVAGQYSTELHYFDGMINLTYVHGSRYHNDEQTPRKSEITFLCDPDAGAGTPTFLSEVASEHYYGFEWRTAYACPSQPVECTAEKDDIQYDLSKLSMDSSQGNWAVESSNGATKYYLNVCRSLSRVNVGNGCGALAAVCRTKLSTGQPESIDIPNLGQIKSGLKVVEKGHLRLTYEGPKTCNNNNGSTTAPYITNIDFVCLEGQTVSQPNPPVQDGPCEYTFVWSTGYACPLQSDNVTEPCTVKDQNSDYVFNLQPLMKSGNNSYLVKVGNTDYKINICGTLPASLCDSINGQPAAVCSVGMDGTKLSLVEGLNYDLQFNEAGRMALVYHGKRKANGELAQVQINFECAPDIDLGQPEFVSQDEDTYIFTFKTSLACSPTATDCLVQDGDGNQYDLGSLSKEDGWSVLDIRDSTTKYYINVCRPVNNIAQSNCPDGPIGGCQVASNGNSYNIGYLQSKPQARSDGSLSVQYRNGDMCHKGTPLEAHRTTRINFFCSQVEDGPVFVTESSTCEYLFNWRSPAACKLQSAKGSDCKVTEPRYGYEFNLNDLRKTSNYHITTGGYDYIINVCGPLVGPVPCNATAGDGACQTKPDTTFTPVSAGKANSDLQYSSGQLTLTYSEGKDNCHGQYTRKTIITFVCDRLKNGLEGPVFIKETENCQYLFEWATLYACPPQVSSECTFSDSGNSYDLTGLTLYNDNYDYTDTQTKTRYLINVCTSVIHKTNATCPYNAAACMVNLTKPDSDKDKYKSIGSATQHLSMENGRLTLTYTGGQSCADGKDYTTKIAFICDADAKDTSPTGHFMAGGCEHHFLWSTAAACPIKQQGPPDSGTPASGITCKVTEPVTGAQIDLSQLTMTSGKPYQVQDNDGHMYEFNICGPLMSSKCQNASKNIGVCQSETTGTRTYNAGNMVSDLWFDDGVVVYNLTGGDRCHGGQYERSTIINFVCNGNKGIGRPVFLDETDDCTYYISWHTNLVCVNEMKCSVDTDDFHTLDLSPLSRIPDNLVQSSLDDSIYYLSVCQPLQPLTGTLCPSGSGACEVKNGSVKPSSLGKPKSAPTFDKVTGSVVMMYLNGSTCDVDPTKNFTSKIMFTCQPGPARSNPVLLDKMGCEYIFRWPTYTVCYDKEPPSPTETCGFTDPWSNEFYNFTALSRSTPFEVNYKNTKYLINMCGSVTTKPSCGKAMVCRDSDGLSFGEPSNFWAERDSGMIKFTYKSGGTCQDGTTAASQILLKCDRTVDDSAGPEYLTGSGCKVEFFWRTSVVCPPIETQCSFADGTKLYDMSLLTRDTGAYELSDPQGNKYWINVCGAIDSTVAGGHCGTNAGACRLNKNGEYDKLGVVTTQQALTKDDAKNAIVLTYGDGDAACSHGKSRSDNDAATTKINFICGTTYGGPVYKSTENCVFEFDWKTKLACQVQRSDVQVNKGKITDPRSGGTINLNPILNQSYDVPLEDGSGVGYKITLNGNSTYCINSVVCEVKDLKHPRLLGTYTSVKYFMDDDLLEAVYTSTEQCKGDYAGKNVTSVIHFHCSHTDKESLELLYESKGCMYVFDWETKVACFNAEVINLPAQVSTAGPSASGSNSASDQGGGSKGGVSSKTVGAIAGVFTTAIVLCILLVVFHKQERRAAFVGGVRRILGKRSEYTQLPTDAADDLQGEEDILTFSDGTSAEANRDEEDPIVTVTPTSYHDDSDEDLLA